MPKIKENADLLELGERIRQKRIEKNLSQEKLAELIDVTRVTVQRMENAQVAISVEKLFRLAEALECSLEELYPKRFILPDFDMDFSGMRHLYQCLDSGKRNIAYQTMMVLMKGLLEEQGKQQK